MRISDWSSDVCSSDLADLLQFNLDVDITPALTFTSQTSYNEDQTYSFQDYNRFKSLPVFTDTSTLLRGGILNPPPSLYRDLAPGGIRSEEHTSELQSLMRISYAVFCLKKKNNTDYKGSSKTTQYTKPTHKQHIARNIDDKQ